MVLWLTPTNDVWNNIFPTHWPKNGWPKPTFRLVDGELRGPSEAFGYQYSWSKIRLFALANRLFGFIDRDGEWENELPEPYKPLSGYSGPGCKDWQERWNVNFCSMRKENLATEKSHYAVYLTPRSPRMQYGLDLTRRLLQEIRSLTETNGGKFVLFSTRKPQPENESCPGPEAVHRLNGKYYRTSKKQFLDNLAYINRGFEAFTIPIKLKQWRFGPEDRHLNEHAVDAVMKDLSACLLPFIE